MTVVVEVEGLRKSYGDFEALKGVSLRVEAGEVVAVLGPNGAGKTTLVEILEGFRTRDAGSAKVMGMDPAHGDRDLRERIGIVLQEAGVDAYLTVVEVLRMHAEYYRAPRPVDEVITLTGLDEKASARVSKLSGGQRRRLDLAVGLVGDPELLFLDEPTTGFDPGARRQAWSVIRNLCSLGKTVLLTTHYMDEAQHLANRVVVLAHGEVVAEGPPASIGGHRRVRVRFRLPAGVSAGSLPIVASARDDGTVLIEADEPTALLHQLTGWAIDRGIILEELTVERASLEDVYLELTQC